MSDLVTQSAENDAAQAPIILTRYRVKVHASNRNSDYGVPVEVYATSRREAVDRAIDVGWAGNRRDARVTVLDIAQECHIPPAVPQPAENGAASCPRCGRMVRPNGQCWSCPIPPVTSYPDMPCEDCEQGLSTCCVPPVVSKGGA